MPNELQQDQYRGYRHPFVDGTHYLGGIGDVPRTLSELAMSRLSAEIRRRNNWWTQYADANYRDEWMHEGLNRMWRIPTPSDHIDLQLSQRQIEYVLDELAGYALLRDESHNWQISQVSCFERIWESDALFDPSRLTDLCQGLSILRGTQTCRRSRSEDGVTTALIDPFLHCVVHERTLVYDTPYSQDLQPHKMPLDPSAYAVSARFAMLPSDFAISSSGSVEALSYINNLDPHHRSLYSNIQDLLAEFVPLFEHVLTDLHRNNPLPQRIKGPCSYEEWDEPEPPEYSDDEDGWSTYQKAFSHWIMQRPIRLPDVPDDGYSGGLEHRKFIVNLRGKTLQTIIGVSEVRLEPGGPGYPGSAWHVEGMKNERIVACAFYYISVENIVGNFLDFRMAVTSPRGFSAGDTGAVIRTWGLRDGEAQVQHVGSVPIRSGLGIAFPNIYQHRHTPCQLLDPSIEGHQTILVFYLVDPEVQPVTSTTKVPPQQEDWMRRGVEEFADPRFPVELVQRIIDEVEGTMSQDEAEAFRYQMLEERDAFRQLSDSCHFCIPFDIWNEVN